MSSSKYINEIVSRSSNYLKWIFSDGDLKKSEYKKIIKESFIKIFKRGIFDG